MPSVGSRSKIGNNRESGVNPELSRSCKLQILWFLLATVSLREGFARGSKSEDLPTRDRIHGFRGLKPE